jgi:hypothetical protein
MVKKLLKHEFIYYFRTFALFLPIVLVIGVMARVFRLFESFDSVLVDIALFSSFSMLLVACAALIMLSVVVSVVRFYKNMYSAEGYLTFTLPVSNAQHIFVKLLTAICCQAICLLTVVISATIALMGEPLKKLVLAIAAGFSEFCEEIGPVNYIAFIFDVIVIVLLSVAGNMLLYYACITVGQMAKKNRILMAVGAYFVYYVATQVVSTVFVMIFTILGMSGAFDGIVMWLDDHMILTMHLTLGFSVVIYAAMSAAFWYVTQRIMTKKLNLE